MSGAFGLGSRAYLGCLASVLLFAGMCPKLWAQGQDVAVSIQGPTLPEGQSKEHFNEIKGILKSSLVRALAPEFSVVDPQVSAPYEMDLNILGPLQGCYWQIQCRWSQGSQSPQKCWDYPTPIPYCVPADVKKIGCLSELVDFSATVVPKPQGALCEEAPADERVKTVYTKCLEFQVEDTNWRDRVFPFTVRVPFEIEGELDTEFKAQGYDIVTADECGIDAVRGEPQKPDIELLASIREEIASGKVYVDLLVRINNEVVPAGIKDVMKGKTARMGRNEFRDNLANAIVDYIRDRWPKNE